MLSVYAYMQTGVVLHADAYFLLFFFYLTSYPSTAVICKHHFSSCRMFCSLDTTPFPCFCICKASAYVHRDATMLQV